MSGLAYPARGDLRAPYRREDEGIGEQTFAIPRDWAIVAQWTGAVLAFAPEDAAILEVELRPVGDRHAAPTPARMYRRAVAREDQALVRVGAAFGWTVLERVAGETRWLANVIRFVRALAPATRVDVSDARSAGEFRRGLRDYLGDATAIKDFELFGQGRTDGFATGGLIRYDEARAIRYGDTSVVGGGVSPMAIDLAQGADITVEFTVTYASDGRIWNEKEWDR